MKRNNVVRKALVFALVMVFLAAVGAMAMEESVTGTVHKTDAGEVMIKAVDGKDYMIEGEDLSAMVGKTVKVTGTLEEKADVTSIKVMKMEEIKE